MRHVRSTRPWCAALALAAIALPALGQGRPDTPALLAAQREAMLALARMDGVWRGEARTTMPNGQIHSVTQTERIGAMLGGSIKLIEGRGHDAGGNLVFNAFGIVSFDPAKRAYSFRSYAQGLSGDFSFQPTADGYTWDIPAGPMIIRYTATIGDGQLHEVGDRIAPGREPVRFFEMTLKRVGDTDWPAAGAVAPR